MNPKESAITIVLGMTKPETGEDHTEMFEEYAEAMLGAVKNSDTSMFASNLKDFVKLCQATDYEAEE